MLEARRTGSFAMDQDNVVIVPIRTLQLRVLGNGDVSAITVAVADGHSTDKATTEVAALMRERKRIGVVERTPST